MPTPETPSVVPTLEEITYQTPLREFLRSICARCHVAGSNSGIVFDLEMADGGSVYKVHVDVTLVATPNAGSNPELRH